MSHKNRKLFDLILIWHQSIRFYFLNSILMTVTKGQNGVNIFNQQMNFKEKGRYFIYNMARIFLVVSFMFYSFFKAVIQFF